MPLDLVNIQIEEKQMRISIHKTDNHGLNPSNLLTQFLDIGANDRGANGRDGI